MLTPWGGRCKAALWTLDAFPEDWRVCHGGVEGKGREKNPVPSSLSGVNPQQKTVESRPLVEAVAEIKT